MNISFSIVDFLILALVVQGIILAALLIYSSKKIKSNFYIGAFIFVISESTLLMEMDYWQVWQSHTWLLTLMVPLGMAYGPLIYFYAYSLIFTEPKPPRKIFLHFLPVLLFMKHQIIFLLSITGILSIPFISNVYVLPLVQKLLFGFSNLSVILAFLSLVIYSVITYNMVSRRLEDKALSANKQADLKWIKMLLQSVSVLISIWFISIIFGYAFPARKLEPWFHYSLFIPAMIFVYWLGMAAYKRQSTMDENDLLEYINKPVKIYFTDDELAHYHKKLITLMLADQVYLNPVLKVDILAAQLNIPEKWLANLLNQHIGKNFNDFVNEFRVEEARKKLVDPAYANFTIAAIALECGFNSLATFQRVFKQIAGITPSQHQNSFKSLDLSANNTQIGI